MLGLILLISIAFIVLYIFGFVIALYFVCYLLLGRILRWSQASDSHEQVSGNRKCLSRRVEDGGSVPISSEHTSDDARRLLKKK